MTVMNIGSIEKEHLASRWDEVAPLLEQALAASAGEMTMEQLRDRITSGEYQLIVGFVETEEDVDIRAVFVAALVRYPEFAAMRIVLGAGEPMDAWIDPLVEKLDEYCRTTGLAQLEIFGRPGFVRALSAWADHQYIVMVRKVL